VRGLERRMKVICKASSTTMYTLLENLVTGLTKFNNAFLVIVRKEYAGSDFKPYQFQGKKVRLRCIWHALDSSRAR
jgi:hypothetical protein